MQTYCLWQPIEKHLKIFLPETTGPILILFCRNVPLVILYQDCSIHCDSSDVATKGAGLICLYMYMESFKTLLDRNHRTDFNITWQECSFCIPLPRLFNPSWFVEKHGRQGAGLISLYIYIENFKNLLVRNHWTDFNITGQKCSFGHPQPRLFKPSWFLSDHLPRLFNQSWFVQKQCRRGAGSIFPVYL